MSEKCRLMNTAIASFNKTVRQMTEMFQWPKCLGEKNSLQVRLQSVWNGYMTSAHENPLVVVQLILNKFN